MDRRTAIEWLEQIKHRIRGGDEEFDRQRKESLDMAITDMKICEANNAGWISVKEGTPPEHDSLFANRPYLSKYMWEKESDDVIVCVQFPDKSRTVCTGRLQDGKWHTQISPVLESVVTHWMEKPIPPKEE